MGIVKLTINLPEELRRRARAVAALRGETVSDVVRAALEKYVNEASELEREAELLRLAKIGAEREGVVPFEELVK